MEHQAEWEKLMSRGSDYDELLRFGSVYARPDDLEDWRAEIRAQARADKLRLRTFVLNEDERIVMAVLTPKRTKQEEFEIMREGLASVSVFTNASDRAKLYGHQPTGFRSEEKQAAAICVRCGASIYVDRGTDPPIIDGSAFDGECPASSETGI